MINALQAPINYTQGFVNLGPAFEGLGSAIGNFGEATEYRNKQIAAQQAKEQFAADLESAQKNGTQAAWTAMIAKYPQFREAFGDVRKGVGEERVKNEFNQGFEISTALENNAPEVAKQRLKTIIDARKNSGEQTGIYQQAYDLIDSGNVKGAQAGINLALSILDPDAYKKTVEARGAPASAEAKVRKDIADADAAVAAATTAQATAANAEEKAKADAQRATADALKASVDAKYAEKKNIADLETQKWNVKNLQNQIGVRGAQLGLDRQRLAFDTQTKLLELKNTLDKVPEGAQKLINDAAIASGAAKQQAGQYNDLATRITDVGGYSGFLGSGAELLKKATGKQDAVSELRQEFTRLRNSAVASSLFSGPSTDKDVALVLEGFPPPNASPKQLASFLRGMAKIKDIDASVESAKADWLAGNKGSLTRANSAFMAGDYAVKPGESFADFQSRVAKDVSARYATGKPAPSSQIPTGAPKSAEETKRAQTLQAADAIIRGGK